VVPQFGSPTTRSAKVFRVGLKPIVETSTVTQLSTGITAYLENGGTIENAQAIAGHESPRTTKLYDRTI
jgi:hypothetical protein